MNEQKAKYTPGPVDIVKVMAEEAYWNALEETIESAGAELDWADTPDNDREKSEIGAAVLMLSAGELLSALEFTLEALEVEAAETQSTGLYTAHLAQARAAIRKAKGE